MTVDKQALLQCVRDLKDCGKDLFKWSLSADEGKSKSEIVLHVSYHEDAAGSSSACISTFSECSSKSNFSILTKPSNTETVITILPQLEQIRASVNMAELWSNIVSIIDINGDGVDDIHIENGDSGYIIFGKSLMGDNEKGADILENDDSGYIIFGKSLTGDNEKGADISGDL